ncbi:electron transport protein SCO1/SenC [Leptothrix cholodnii SP-6]|jgi:protein SCO1/2|uniref:Electron transport protein SCO1/SenC n=1 Tax=Leptothrix cholodnii (strain ATCC 51168 / LMG 8142 / SP-6) TaxID=395495 RepID=B1Y1G3_LEPCP|nr:SCO family protein [Leptothrix cholodnii]ACB34262.1 electron transport protein SCO1/SenC [Leptothrix cholodnii SP-6]
MLHRRRFQLSLLAAGVLALAGCKDAPPPFKNLDITGSDYARSFDLQAPDGRNRSLADFKGRLVMVFFGFTQCPDVCPTALSRAVAVRQMLGADAERLQVIFITVDPERDTAELLSQYMAAFDPSFLALRGDLVRTTEVAREFKVFFNKVPTGSSYTMDHTALSYVFDTQGRLRLAVRHSQGAEDVAHDLKLLLHEST